ncbi:hypothetical protein [Marivita sp.]|nr:hypothetical protein [Marivita sp.]
MASPLIQSASEALVQKFPVGGTVGPVQFQTRVRTDLIFVM